MNIRAWRATAPAPGAIAVIQLVGDVEPALRALTGRRAWPVGAVRLAPFEDIDEGLAVRVTPTSASLMPHGGVHVVARLLARLEALGATIEPAPPDEAVFPEADPGDAHRLAALARAASPLAVPRLLAELGRPSPATWSDADLARSRRLDRLVDPPLVVLVGRPNAGKSTLTNALAGRRLVLAHAEAGTTRDHVGVRLDLGGLVVQWHDTPGLRPPAHVIEAAAIEAVGPLLDAADLLIAVAPPDGDWPVLPRPPDLRVATKADLGGRTDADLAVAAAADPGHADSGRAMHAQPADSGRAMHGRPAAPGRARHAQPASVDGTGLDGLVTAIRDHLVPPADLADPGPWQLTGGAGWLPHA